jgi:putative SOS response-associated peptidase YedK
MPVIIAPEAYGAWLDPGVRLEELLPLLAPFPADAMVGYPVSSVVNRAGVEDPRAVEPARQETLF